MCVWVPFGVFFFLSTDILIIFFHYLFIEFFVLKISIYIMCFFVNRYDMTIMTRDVMLANYVRAILDSRYLFRHGVMSESEVRQTDLTLSL